VQAAQAVRVDLNQEHRRRGADDEEIRGRWYRGPTETVGFSWVKRVSARVRDIAAPMLQRRAVDSKG
jgi:hypothetical protein